MALTVALNGALGVVGCDQAAAAGGGLSAEAVMAALQSMQGGGAAAVSLMVVMMTLRPPDPRLGTSPNASLEKRLVGETPHWSGIG